MRSFSDMPIRQKLMVIIMVATTAALLVAGIGIIVADSILYRGYLERDLWSLARIIADNSTAALAFEDPQSAAETLASLRARTHVVTACIYRGDGTVIAAYSRPDSQAPCPPALERSEVHFAAADVTVSRRIILDNREIGTFVLLYDLGEINERVKVYGITVLSVLLISSLIALLLSARLRAVIASPLAELAHAAGTVSETRDFSVRAEKLTGDELGVVVDAFNEMLARIQSRDDDLKAALQARENALLEAQKARDSLKTTLASIGDAVISTDAEGRVVFVNAVARDLLGRPEADIVGRNLDEVFHIVNEFSRAEVESPVTKVLREGAIVGLANHTILVAKDGTEIPIEDSGAPIRASDGTIQGTVLVFRDVTARRRAEETSRLLASIVEYSGDAIIGKNLDGIVTSWNTGAERIYGYTAEEMIGRPISLLAAFDGEDEMAGTMERIRKGESIDQYEAVRRTKSGRLINVSLTVSPMPDALGRVVGASTIARDITDRVRAARRLAQLNADLISSNERLARSNEDLERFAYVASHDLQEPLRMITLYSQLLVRSYPGVFDARAEEFVGHIVVGTKRMRDLLADLLAYAEIGAGLETPLHAVDLNAVIEKVRQNLRLSIEESGAVITAGRLPTLSVYEGHFVSLFQNLVANAIKYRGEEPPRIHISVQETDGQQRFAVRDNGIGIKPEYHQKVFSAFKRLHGRDIPGTGIGLAICQRVVHRYGGRIWVESQPGEGSTFYFTVPGNSGSKEETK